MINRFARNDHSKIWLHVAGILSASIYYWLAVESRHYADLSSVLISVFPCFAIGIALWVYYRHRATQPPVCAIVAWALVFRLIAVSLGEPLLEDDHYRYLWDGFLFVETGNPYGLPPEIYFEHDGLGDTFEGILGNINNPHIATIYGPVCQYLFGFAYLVAPGEIWPLQLIFAIADVAIVLLLLKMTSPANVLLYAWSPLVLKEFAFTAHTDVFGAMLVLAAWILAARYNQRSWRYFAVAVLMAFAVATKVFAVLPVPFLFGMRIRQWFIFAITLLLLYLPFLLNASSWGGDGLRAMATVWLFNSPIYYVFIQLFPNSSVKPVQITLALLFAFFYLVVWWRFVFRQTKNIPDAEPAIRPDWLYGVFFLTIPAMNAWYLIWLLPFAAIKPSVWAWTASMSLFLSYATGLHLASSGLQAYEHPIWVLALEYGVILIALMVDVYIRRRKKFSVGGRNSGKADS